MAWLTLFLQGLPFLSFSVLFSHHLRKGVPSATGILGWGHLHGEGELEWRVGSPWATDGMGKVGRDEPQL